MTLIKIHQLPNIKNIFSILLILGSLLWLVWIIKSNLTHDWKEVLPKNYGWLFFALVVGVLSQYINILIFSKLLRVNKSKFNLLQISKLFFTGQIVRYIPGRVWGIIYQVVNTLPCIPKKNIVLANIELMFISFSGLLTISTSIFVYSTNKWYFSIPIFIIGFTIITLILIKGWLSIIIKIANLLLKKNKQKVSFTPLSLNICLSAISLFILSWSIYLLGWVIIGEAGYGSDSPYTMLILASTYSISWFIGYISMITPSGIGVREASFLLLSQGIIATAELALLALVIRLWLLIIDLILFLIFTPVKLNKEVLTSSSN